MTKPFNRRRFLVSAGAASLAAPLASLPALAGQSARVVIVGGGFGGASAAGHLKSIAPHLDVTLIEANKNYVSCPFSNLVIGSGRGIDAQTFGYEGLEKAGIRVLIDKVVGGDPGAKSVSLGSGNSITYDRLIISPGIDMRWNAIEGYDEKAAVLMPHAWKAGNQTLQLRKQLEAMDDGGLVVIAPPATPYRCPPGPYERASLIAEYLNTHKPKSKLMILDVKDSFSKQGLFQDAWATHYGETLEWVSTSEGGTVDRIDANAGKVMTFFDEFKPAVANIIPPQKAGKVAEALGVADATGWCPIDGVSFESTLQPGIHVIGDAAIAAPMPKSAFAANVQGKVCAIQVARLLSGLAPEPTVLANTCYSFVTSNEAVSVSDVFRNETGRLEKVAGAGGLSPRQAEPSEREKEAAQAKDWFSAITREAFK